MPPTHQSQEAEAQARNEARAREMRTPDAKGRSMDPGRVAAFASENTAGAADVVDDGARVDPGSTVPQPQRAEGEQPQPRPAPAKSPFQSKREEIISRFRKDRTEKVETERDEITDFARAGGIPPEWAGLDAEAQPQPQPQPEPQIEAEPEGTEPIPEEIPPAQHKYKVKVHGEEKELTAEELIAKAQIALASENILDEVKALKRELQSRASAPPQGQPDRPVRQQSAAPEPQTPAEGESEAVPSTNEGKLAKLIEALQFGDPNEAQNLLQNTIAEMSAATVQQVLQTQRLKDEGARSGKVLEDFKKDHPEIANDPMAEAAIQYKVYEHQLKDLHDLGIDPNQIQTGHEGSPTPGDIAMAHRWYRSEGFRVRSPQELLTTATGEFLDWKGVKTNQTNPAQPAPNAKAAPRIEVNRDARRQQIPQQPSQTVTPRAAPSAPQAPQPRDRSEIVASMRQSRAKPRGQIIPQ